MYKVKITRDIATQVGMPFSSPKVQQTQIPAQTATKEIRCPQVNNSHTMTELNEKFLVNKETLIEWSKEFGLLPIIGANYIWRCIEWKEWWTCTLLWIYLLNYFILFFIILYIFPGRFWPPGKKTLRVPTLVSVYRVTKGGTVKKVRSKKNFLCIQVSNSYHRAMIIIIIIITIIIIIIVLLVEF